jgi:hypothetical protein
MNVTDQLLQIESGFEEYRSGFQYRYLLIAALYFSPPVILIFVLSGYFKSLFQMMPVKIILALMVLAALILHYYLRNTWFKTNRNYQNFIRTRLETLFPDINSSEETKTKIVEAARSYFQTAGKPFNNIRIRKELFWYNLFIVLKIEINPDE